MNAEEYRRALKDDSEQSAQVAVAVAGPMRALVVACITQAAALNPLFQAIKRAADHDGKLVLTEDFIRDFNSAIAMTGLVGHVIEAGAEYSAAETAMGPGSATVN